MSRKNVEDIYRLSPVQQGMLFHALYEPEGPAYFEQFYYEHAGPLDVERFLEAWRRALARHPILRTAFVWEGLDEPVQVVHRRVELPAVRRDLSGLPPEEGRRAVEAYLEEDRRTGFDLSEPPLLRISVLCLGEERHEIVLSYHHVLLDGWSSSLLSWEVGQIYEALGRGEEPELPEPRPFRDFIAWLRRQDLDAARAYWSRVLAGVEGPTPLPAREAGTGGSGPVEDGREYGRQLHVVSERTVSALRQVARRHQVTLASAVQAAWAATLAAFSGSRDPVFGLTVSGRPASLPGVEKMLGCFINTLPVRRPVPAAAPLGEWLRRILNDQAELARFEHSPLPEVRRWAGIPGDRELFDSILVFENYGPAASGGRTVDYQRFQRTNYALTLIVLPEREMTIDATYRTERLDELTVRRMVRHLTAALERLAGDPATAAPLLDPPRGERHAVLAEWNDTAEALDATSLLHRRIVERARRTPEAVAVVCEGSALSYDELDDRSRRLAGRLRALGVGPEVLVALSAERSLEMVVGLLGILRAGGAYVPVDPEHPAERLAFMLRDAGAPVLLTQARLAEALPAHGARVVLLDGATEEAAGAAEPAPAPADPGCLAYAIFTSGSTGRPKGAMNAHRGILNRLDWMGRHYRLDASDRVLQKTPFSFDVSVWELFLPLLVGARLVMVRPGGHRDPAYLADLIAREGVTTVHFVPSMLQAFVDAPGVEACTSLRRVIASGEALPRDLAERWRRRLPVPLHNLYGPTEAAVDVTAWPAAPGEGGASVPIGRPVANTRILVLSPEGRPVPMAAPGELHIGGVQVGRGYLGRPSLTAERFVPDGTGAAPGERLYRTGDLVCRGPAGELRFLGRLDFQVKVRGFRIELGEIEAAAATHPAVQEAAVVARELGPGDVRLAAYAVPAGAEAPTLEELREHLARSLPEAMLPSALVLLPAMPLSPSGKLDRRALPEPPAWGEAARTAAYEPPRTPTEELLAGLWSRVLGVERPGREDDFFALGGHSLLATRVVSRLREDLGVQVPVRALFEDPTLRRMAARVDGLRAAERGRPEPPLLPVARDRGTPLSFAQERLWFLARMEPESPAYNVPAALRLRGRLDLTALARAVAAVVDRQESLRTIFEVSGGRPVQVVLPRLAVPLPVIDLSRLGDTAGEKATAVLARREVERPFDLAAPPLLRTLLVRRAPEEHVAVVTLHHVVSDAWSLGIFARELGAGYAAAVEGRPARLPPLSVQYPDFAVWQRAWLQGEVLEEQLAYWRERLAGAPASLELPTDRPRPRVQSFRGGALTVRVPEAAARSVRELARERGATLFMVIMAGFQALLARYSGQGDLVVGTTLANRTREPVQGLVGFFVNTVALRADLGDDPAFGSLVGRVRGETLGAHDHQDLPFEKLVAEIQPERDLSRSPLFQVVLQLLNAPMEPLELPGLTLEPVLADTQTAKFDLVVNVAEAGPGGGLQAVWRYRRDLFDPTTVRRMASHLRVLLETAGADPRLRVSELPLLTPAERHAVLAEEGRATATGPPAAGSARDTGPVHARFAAWADACPDAVAITCEGVAVTYGELQRRAGRLARVLARRGVGPDVPVALCLERSVELVTAVLGVLGAGGAYVPLDPAYPRERVAYTLEDCGAPVAVTREGLRELLPDGPEAPEVVCLEDLPGAERTAPAPAPAGGAAGAHRAYVIYTSGSTGRPKGVEVTHHDVARLFTVTADRFRPGPGDVWTLFHSYAFDFSVWELWGALAHGGRLVVVPHGVSRSPAAFHDLLRREGVTVLNQTPSAFRQLVQADAGAPPLDALRLVVFGGEALELASLAPWLGRYGDRRPRLVNMYGITETTVHVTWRTVGRDDLERGHGSVIGRAIPDLELHVLDPWTRPVPLGVPGEIHVGGEGLARGYLARPGLTAERFVPDPLAGRAGRLAGARLYRSGDLARRRPGADHEYLGRIDHQVKVRGFRIELGEIETALASHPAVAEAVVVARPGPVEEAGVRLVAYAVPSAGSRPAAAELRAHVAAFLPDHMVPASFVLLPALPLTPNGKVDRAALPEPDAARPEQATAPVPPRDRLEELLAGLWREVLGVEAVGIHDDFFDLGGNSLVGAVLVNKLQEALGEIVHVVLVFDAPSVAEMAEHLRRQHPVAVARVLGEGVGEGPADEGEAAPVDEAMVARARELVAAMPRFSVPPPGDAAEPRNPAAVFVLSAPRSGSTLLRVMLGGHPRLFAPPELELLSFATLADRREVFAGRDAFWREGLLRAVMEIEGCDADAARGLLAEGEAEARPTRRVYAWLQERLGDRLLVDKTPSYALRRDVLERAEAEFRDARYVHLVRHPYGMIHSFEEAKLDQIFFPAEHDFPRRRLAELVWLVSERNVRVFLEGVPAERRHRVRYEDLVLRPEETLRALCAFLGLPYEPAMAEPYGDPRGRMTDGIHAESRMLGDVKFHQHAGVDPEAAERWRLAYRRDFLGEPTRAAAAVLGYEPMERPLPPIEPAGWSPGEPLPLSFAQERLWFLDQLDPGTPTYNVPVAVRLTGELDLRVLRGAWAALVRRQASLRTTFAAGAEGPTQVVAPAAPAALPVVDLAGLPEPARRRQAEALAEAEARRPFDLARGPLARIALLRLGGEDHALLLTLHHVVSDGWSMGLLVRETAELYAARMAGRAARLPELPVQYADFALWQRRTVSAEALERQLAHWRERLAALPVLQLPTDRPRPAVQTFRGSTRPFRFPEGLGSALRRLAADRGTTLYVALLAAYQAFLGRWAGQDDFAVGSPFANRGRSEVEGLVGFFVNTLVLRADLAGGPSVHELLSRTRRAVRDAFVHQDVPFERVVQEVQPDRNLAVPPLFQAMLAHQEGPAVEAVDLPGLALEPLPAPAAISKFDLTLTVLGSGPELGGQWVWNVDLFDPSTVERIGRSFETFLAALADGADRRVSRLPLLAEPERRQVVVEWNRPPVEYPSVGTAAELVRARAEAAPDAVAVVQEGVVWTYGELASRARRLARRLAGLGIGPEAVVAVAGGRSPELVAGLLGVLEAGASYLPLDPALPPRRLGFMLADAGAAAVLADGALAAAGGPFEEALDAAFGARGERPPTILLDAPEAAFGDGAPGEETAPPDGPPPGAAAAYVIYTSGSTGRPKGVVVSQEALGNRLAYARAVDLGPDDSFLQKTVLSFDVSVLEVFGPLVSGGRTVLPRPGGEADAAYLVDLVLRERVTQTSFPPTLLHGLLEEEGFRRLASLRTVITGGETVPPELPDRFYRVLDADLLNRYGPTETTVSVTSWRCEPGRPERSLPIGRPTARAAIHVLDRGLEPVPPGVVGEIVVGGPGVARGYLRRPARTAAAFVPDPFAVHPGRRVYRTGDLGRFRPDGAVEFAGRLDTQVKIRGFRVELGEIEAVLAREPGVREVAVVARGEGAARAAVAYAVPGPGATVEPERLRAAAGRHLPPYMVPSAVVVLDALPLTPTGKIDRNRLPDPAAPAADRPGSEPPRGPVEELVAAVWADVLGRDRVGRDDDFFDLGGHSLLATRVVARLRQALGVELALRRLFEEPTVAGIAREVEAARAAGGAEAPPLERAPRPASGPAELPVSFAQERLWFLERLVPSTAAFHMVARLRLSGELDVPALAATVRALERRHETLRTAFREVDGLPVQRIEPPGPPRLGVVDLTALPGPARAAEAEAASRRHAVRPFDLGRAPLARWALLRLGGREHRLLLALHHAMSDGWSMGVLVREVGELYRAFVAGRAPSLPELPVQYGDFARWQRRWLSGEVLEGQLGFWRRQLAGAPPALELPTDRPRPAVPRFRGGYERVRLPAAVAEALHRLARAQGATLFMVLLAAVDALFSRLAGEGDVVVGTPVAGRGRAETEGLVGFFLNNLVLRVRLDDAPSFRTLVVRVREVTLDAYAHQDLPFEKLVEALVAERDPSRAPLFQHALVLQNAPVGALELPGLKLEPLEADTGTTRFDLSLALGEAGEGLAGRMFFNRDLYDRTTVRRMLGHLETLIGGALEEPDLRVQELPLLTEGEREELRRWNRTAAAHPLDRTLHELVVARAAAIPEAVAVVSGGEHVSHAELTRRADALARRLAALGAGPETVVALCAERSVEMMAGLLAILRTGAAYVPLDPSYPEERLAFMLADSGAPAVLVQERVRDRIEAALAASGAVALALDAPGPAAAGSDGAADPGPEPRAHPDGLAYVIYTSGSTGRPKGVMNRHRGIVNRLLWMEEAYGLDGTDRVLQKTPVSFDVSVWELFWPLLAGAALVMARPEGHKDPAYLVETLAAERITTVHFVPSMLRAFLGAPGVEACRSLRRTIASGEALPPGLVERHHERLDAPLHNLYGPTEAAVDVSWWPARPGDGGASVPIGHPVSNTRLHVLDPGLRQVPVGVAGELCLAGVQLARGYRRRPALTAACFVPDPLAEEPGGRLYRTGDLAKRLPDGAVDFLGRIDHQVKLRGFRIELGEVEATLGAHPAVREAAVSLRSPRDGRGEPRLVGYVVADGEVPDATELRRFLAVRLPDYMVPSAFVPLAALPLSPSGKVDRRALPDPEEDAPAGRGHVEPRDAVEAYLAGLWREVLGKDRIGVHDDFFAAGGSSLAGAVAVNRLQETLGELVHVVVIFDHPTVAELARYLREEHQEAVARLWSRELAAGTEGGEEDLAPRVTEEDVEALAALLVPLPDRDRSSLPRNPPAVFVLAPPRSGTTLLRVMLGGHPGLFAPPELELLSFDTLAERRAAFPGRDAFRLEGLTRAVMEALSCGPEEAEERLRELEARGATAREAYGWLQGLLGGRVLVDKTPTYAFDARVLARAEEDFENARYVHLVRHPYGVVRSFEEARLDQIFFARPHPFARRRLAELLWLLSHRNVLAFLDGVPRERWTRVRFEDLVERPERELRRLCEVLQVDYHPAMAAPYADREARMTDGLHAESRMIGDVKFHQHAGVDPEVAWRWREAYDHDFLGEPTWELARELGYDPAATRAGTWIPLAPVARRPGEPVPASFNQERLWFLDRLDPGSSTYSIPASFRLEGALDPAALGRAVVALARRHETLRTSLVLTGDRPVQVIEPAPRLGLARVDLSGLPSGRREAAALRAKRQARRGPFDLSRGPLARVVLVRLAEEDHELTLVFHHIVSDGWSLGVAVQELAVLYGALSAGERPPLPPLPVQYADYAAWQRRWLTGETLRRQLGYWRDALAGVETLQLPTDRPRPRVQTFRGGTRTASLPAALAPELAAVERGERVTRFMVLLAAYAAVLGRTSGQDAFAVGTPVANRSRVETEGLIGLFINTVAVRVDLSGGVSFRDLVRRVRRTALGAFAHQEVPFDRVVEEVRPERNLSRSPLFQVLLAMGAEREQAALELPGLRVSGRFTGATTAKLDLTLAVARGGPAGSTAGPEATAVWMYNRDLFDAATVERLARHFGTLLAAGLRDPDRRLAELPFLTPGERQQLLEWNDTARARGDATLHGLIRERAARVPDAVAVTFEDRAVSYRELGWRAREVAAHLRAAGVGPEDRVGVAAERSVELVVGLLGVLEAGAAYVPVDPAYPAERRAFMLADSGARIVLAQGRLREDLAELLPAGVEVLALDRLPPAAGAPAPFAAADPDGAAYAIYTSGSTGRPKGAVNTHRAIVNRLLWMQETYGLGPNDRVLQKTPVSFDVSVWELFWPLLSGATLVMARPGGHQDPGYLAEVVRAERVTTMHFVPSMLQVFLEAPGVEECTSLRRVIASGEALPAPLVRRYHRRLGAPLHNLYGPTEAAVDVTYQATVPDVGETVPIGRPVANTRVHVVDRELTPVPAGVAGELLLGGVQLARGYHARPALTADRFVPDPMGDAPGGRLYRTGDLTRFLADGAVDFLGRLDHQVKLRGFRIELGEIEAALADLPGVREAVVLARAAGGGEARLVAYLVPHGEPPEGRELRAALAARLPEYMVPSAFVALEELPLSPSGKLDRNRLPDPGAAAGPAGAAEGGEAPRTPLEELLAASWASLLGLEAVGVHDDFFERGGSSLTGAVFINQLQRRLGEIVHVVALFDHPTVARFAGYLAERYPRAVTRVLGDGAHGGLEAPADAPSEARVDEAMVREMRRLVPARRLPRGRPEKNPRAVFVLGPPRSGTTLLRVLLAGHPDLFAPPELELLPYATLAERRDAFPGRDRFRLEGLPRAVMEARGCGAEKAEALVEELADARTATPAAYRRLQEWIGGRTLVDKTPTYAWFPEALDAAEAWFEDPLYVHLVRHPYGVISSFEEARLDEVFFRFGHSFTPRQLAELLWIVSHRNVLRFFEGVPEERRLRVDFERLVRDPEVELRRLCSFLGVEYRPAMVDPYGDLSGRMTDGLHAESRMLGDVKFHQHRRIDPAVADRWRDRYRSDFLGPVAWDLAARLGLDEDRVEGRPLPPGLVGLRPGGSRPPLFLVHPVSGDVYFYRHLAAALDPEQPVYGFEAPGLDGASAPPDSLEAMAERYVENLLAFRPEGPYLLAGSSMGGVLAHEMARLLAERGRQVAFLGLLDAVHPAELPGDLGKGHAAEAALVRFLTGGRDEIPEEELARRSEDERLGLILERARAAGGLPPGLDRPRLASLVAVLRANGRALGAHRPRRAAGKAVFFRAEEWPAGRARPTDEAWRSLLAEGLETVVVPGAHLSMHFPPHVAALAAELQRRLDEAGAREGPEAEAARNGAVAMAATGRR